jgi:diguanylate cyclase (GGDEF)-like protein
MLLTAVAIFATEAGISRWVEARLSLVGWQWALADAGLLVGVTLPVVYFAWFRPLRRELEWHVRAAVSLETHALSDALTALPNRVAFLELIEQALATARLAQAAFTVAVLDVHRFGEVNGALGHESGDLLLKLIGERLRSARLTHGVAARLESDLFAVLLTDVDAAGAPPALERLHELVEVPFALGEAPIEIEVHTGFAAFPQHGDTPHVLLQRAELALTRAKKNGERGQGYREESESEARRRLALVRSLRGAIERGGLSLVYQPKLALDGGQFAGVEALARWNDPELGFVSPGEFVPLAEQTNLIRPLTLWVLREAIRQMAAWKSAGLDVPVSVNLSARNLVDETLPDRVKELLREWDIEPRYLMMEVTESAVLADPERAGNVIERFQKSGVALSIDDFGTGYSSLTYVRTMPAAELKIDRSFVKGLESSESNTAIVRAVVGLAHSLGMKVVCEGVETDAALLRLRELGCDFAQGYLLSRPLPAREVLDYVAKSAFRVFGNPYDTRANEVRPSRLSLLPRHSRPPLRDSLRAIRARSSPS